MDEPIKVYKNLIWEILDDGSKLYILELLIERGFKGDCKVIAKDGSLEVNDNFNNQLVIPINILDILNE